ncbi:hypothetical protein ACFX2J_018378 [Malus domestica]
MIFMLKKGGSTTKLILRPHVAMQLRQGMTLFTVAFCHFSSQLSLELLMPSPQKRAYSLQLNMQRQRDSASLSRGFARR